LLTDFPVRHGVIRIVEVELVDLFFRNEFVDVDDPLALDSDRFQLFGIEFKVLALADLVALDDVFGGHFVAAVCVYLAILDAVTGLLVDLMEADFFPLDVAGNRAIGHETRDSLR
jgi:hypothetical protein